MSASIGEVAELLEDLPRLVRAERHRRGLSLDDAAPLVGVSADTLAALELDRRDVSLSTVRLVLAWLLEDNSRTLREVV